MCLAVRLCKAPLVAHEFEEEVDIAGSQDCARECEEDGVCEPCERAWRCASA